MATGRRRSVVLLLMTASAAASAGPEPDHGTMRKDESGGYQAWDHSRSAWVSPEQFWLNFADGRGGVRWGRGAEYPPYAQVQEHDLFMVGSGHGHPAGRFA